MQVGLLPLQPPPAQLTKVELAAGVSVSVTWVPPAKLALQVGAQLIPEGLLEIVPVPVPIRLTVSTGTFWMALKLAVTCWLALSVRLQVGLLPLQPPVHPAKDEFAAAVSVSVTWVPLVKLVLQVGAQLIPPGLLATVPAPASVTVSTTAFWMALKLAVTCWLALSVNMQVGLLPLQPPVHPANEEFAAAASVRAIEVPLAKLALQEGAHVMPAGLLLTVPPPAPVAWTVSLKEAGGGGLLLGTPPQLLIRSVELKQQTTVKHLNLDMGTHILYRLLDAVSMTMAELGLPGVGRTASNSRMRGRFKPRASARKKKQRE